MRLVLSDSMTFANVGLLHYVIYSLTGLHRSIWHTEYMIWLFIIQKDI